MTIQSYIYVTIQTMREMEKQCFKETNLVIWNISLT